jgi:mannan endo-1,6-alpha-mannosidase
MSVLGALLSILPVPVPLTNTTGGTSKGDPDAGTNSTASETIFRPVTTGDKAGAAILTMTVLAAAVATFYWMNV